MYQLENNFRKNSNLGVWCVLLVPVCLFISRFDSNFVLKFQDGLMLTLSAFITLSSLTQWHRIKYNTRPKINRMLGDSNNTDLTALFVFGFVVFIVSGFNSSSLVTIAGLVLYNKSIPLVYTKFPGSFTFGEGCIVLQSITLFIVHAITSLLNQAYHPTSSIESFTLIAQVALLSEAFLFALPLIPGLTWTKCPTFFYAVSLVLLGSCTLPVLMKILRMDPLSLLVTYFFSSKSILKLIILWLILVIIAMVIVSQKFDSSNNATTGERKVFHGLIVVVMISGMIVDIEYTYFASLVVLGIFMYLEYIRVFDIRPVSRLLDEAFAKFTDEKDQGSLILTNIYLLVGIFLPLWITGDLSAANNLILLSGVLSVGIGDSVASIVGSRYGYLKWPYSPSKSVDGTLASVTAQIIFLEVLALNNVVEYQYDLSVFLPIILTSLVEAHTTQVDNLVLPLVMYISYSAMLSSKT